MMCWVENRGKKSHELCFLTLRPFGRVIHCYANSCSPAYLRPGAIQHTCTSWFYSTIANRHHNSYGCATMQKTRSLLI